MARFTRTLPPFPLVRPWRWRTWFIHRRAIDDVRRGFVLSNEAIALAKHSLWSRLVITSDGLTQLNNRDEVWSFRWADVVEITVWKVDLFAFDEICMGFRLRGSPDYLIIHEHLVDWDAVTDYVNARFQTPEWYGKIAFKAFETQWTTIWGTPPLGEFEKVK